MRAAPSRRCGSENADAMSVDERQRAEVEARRGSLHGALQSTLPRRPAGLFLLRKSVGFCWRSRRRVEWCAGLSRTTAAQLSWCWPQPQCPSKMPRTGAFVAPNKGTIGRSGGWPVWRVSRLRVAPRRPALAPALAPGLPLGAGVSCLRLRSCGGRYQKTAWKTSQTKKAIQTAITVASDATKTVTTMGVKGSASATS
jgi:hypothetical protein